MKNYKFLLIIHIFVIFLVLPIYAVQSSVHIAYLHLEMDNVPPQLERTINEIILSFTAEIKGYVVEDFNVAKEEDIISSPDILYIFTGRMIGLMDGVRLELIFKNRKLEIVRYISKDYDGSNKILLDSRLLVKELFAMQDNVNIDIASHVSNAHKKNDDIIETVEDAKLISNLDSLTGAWYGEDGEVEKIMIMRGGRGIAIWTSGISLLLELKLENGYLIVTQKGLPQPRQFIDLPDNIANLAAKSAKPIVWKLNVDQDLKILSGLKTTSTIKHNSKEIISISEVSIPVKWHRN